MPLYLGTLDIPTASHMFYLKLQSAEIYDLSQIDSRRQYDCTIFQLC